MSTWTKFSERLPEEGVREVFVIPTIGAPPFVAKRKIFGSWTDWAYNLAWHPITYPELPKEETQEEKDRHASDSAWSDAQHKCALNGGGWFTEGFFAGLRYERAEVAKELAKTVVGIMPDVEAVDRLRRRVGLDK